VARLLRHSAAGCALLFAFACNGGAPPSKSAAPTGPVRGGTLTASLRSEPPTFNRLGPDAQHSAVDAVTRLAHAPLVRINRATDQPEPWLAEKWTVSPDGRVITLTLRDGLVFSDGVPCTSDDVVFTFKALYDKNVHSVLATGMVVYGRPLTVTAPDPRTVVVTLPAPSPPACRCSTTSRFIRSTSCSRRSTPAASTMRGA
jgi:peptide/nickel transport system substrate-binding protein